MIAEIENFETGWFGVSLGFNPEEIDRLVELLQFIKKNENEHFHMSSLFSSNDKGIADIEIFMMGKDKVDNMVIEGDN